MAPALNFYAGQNHAYLILPGSGLGFYGSSFGSSVEVSAFQDRTFITDGATGTVLGPECNNVKYPGNTGSGILGQAGSGIALTCIPNAQSTLNVRFTNDTSVKTQAARLRIYDRVSTNNDPSGVLCRVYETLHPTTSQINNGSGAAAWTVVFGSGSILSLANSPASSGEYAGNGATSQRSDTRHDWYVALTASPSTISSHYFGLAISLEYL